MPRERNLAELDDSDLADLLQVIRVRLPNFLLRRGVGENRDEPTLLDDDFAERDPALAQLAAAGVACKRTALLTSSQFTWWRRRTGASRRSIT